MAFNQLVLVHAIYFVYPRYTLNCLNATLFPTGPSFNSANRRHVSVAVNRDLFDLTLYFYEN